MTLLPPLQYLALHVPQLAPCHGHDNGDEASIASPTSGSHMTRGAKPGPPGTLYPHLAWQRFLDLWLPLLLEECRFAAAFLGLYAPPEDAIDIDARSGARLIQTLADRVR